MRALVCERHDVALLGSKQGDMFTEDLTREWFVFEFRTQRRYVPIIP
jgi:hypothetical protein